MPLPVPEHFCQLFDSDETRADSVAAFLADGLRAGEFVIAVPRQRHWPAVVSRLTALGISVDEEISEGRMLVQDATSTLARISPRGRLSPFAFNAVMGVAVKELAGRRIRGYGEMVDILAERGEFEDAIELEELWNHLSEMVPLTIMCAYTAAHFVPVAAHRPLRDLCLAHTDVRRDPHDALSNWILTMAHHAGGSSLH